MHVTLNIGRANGAGCPSCEVTLVMQGRPGHYLATDFATGCNGKLEHLLGNMGDILWSTLRATSPCFANATSTTHHEATAGSGLVITRRLLHAIGELLVRSGQKDSEWFTHVLGHELCKLQPVIQGHHPAIKRRRRLEV